MNTVKSFISGIGLLALSSSAFALTSAEQNTYNQLASGDLIKIKKASQSLVSQSNSNAELLDVLAEFVAQNYLTAPAYELDTIAWACRALGETGSARYRDLLSEITSSDAHKKIRKYAKKALRQTPTTTVEQYTVGSINLTELAASTNTNTSNTNNLSPSDKIKYDIASGNLVEIKQLAQRYSANGIASTDNADLLAEYFSRHYTTGQTHQYDTLAWICKALSRDNTGRYKNLIENAHENSPIRAVRKHCPDEIDGDGPYYQAGSLDLETMVKID
ncbi:hypothetical protein J8L70_09595 [Pseudoalteromonas sp. MMG010]|uniref:hypothetical protein n=1 Tax=Pseudoalteromonas sp. MMG010 TaxID=2822685 RepID=UPI001B3A03A9|nr:hypothetical protein [Pseudoalteromonas sp. MMG010]MBQ4833491.1 hypothetical protein [Pseudoalteromonas sp. MMG010]